MDGPTEDAGYGKVPLGPVQTGAIAALSESEAKVYIVICAHANRQGLRSWPSLATIGTEAGLARRTVQRAVAGLEAKHLTTVKRGRGRGDYSVYTLVEKGVCQTDAYPKPEKVSRIVEKVAPLRAGAEQTEQSSSKTRTAHLLLRTSKSAKPSRRRASLSRHCPGSRASRGSRPRWSIGRGRT